MYFIAKDNADLAVMNARFGIGMLPYLGVDHKFGQKMFFGVM